MSASLATDRVPLAVWRLGHPSPDASPSPRQQLAERIVHIYGRDNAVVTDIGHGTSGANEGSAASADLVVALPTDSFIVSMRSFAFPPDRCATLAQLASECLRPGGYLIVGSISGPGVDPITSTVAAAARAGLPYFQHVVVLAAPVTSATPLTIGRCPRRPGHIDLLVFEKGAA